MNRSMLINSNLVDLLYIIICFTLPTLCKAIHYCGKSFLAQAIGHQACMMEYKVLYSITSRLFKRLKLSRMDGTYMNDINKLAKTDVLILDDFGLQAFDKQDRESLMDIIEDRHSKKTTIVASQIPVSVW
jgi:DNA replication protein DnaC